MAQTEGSGKQGTKGSKSPRRRHGRMSRAAELVPDFLSPAMRRRGIAQSGLILRWRDIAGLPFADICRPERIAWPRGDNADPDYDPTATLHIVCRPGFAPEMQHLAPLLLERLNRYYGYRALGHVKIRQAPLTLTPEKRRPKKRELTEQEQAELAQAIAPVPDKKLQDILYRLGHEIMSRPDKNVNTKG